MPSRYDFLADVTGIITDLGFDPKVSHGYIEVAFGEVWMCGTATG